MKDRPNPSGLFNPYLCEIRYDDGRRIAVGQSDDGGVIVHGYTDTDLNLHERLNDATDALRQDPFDQQARAEAERIALELNVDLGVLPEY